LGCGAVKSRRILICDGEDRGDLASEFALGAAELFAWGGVSTDDGSRGSSSNGLNRELHRNALSTVMSIEQALEAAVGRGETCR